MIQFASISRDPEIYKLAANYLQQMNWRESVDILKAITTFYTKAKAFVQLAAFYDSCGQVCVFVLIIVQNVRMNPTASHSTFILSCVTALCIVCHCLPFNFIFIHIFRWRLTSTVTTPRPVTLWTWL